jgi:hypothetical protein
MASGSGFTGTGTGTGTDHPTPDSRPNYEFSDFGETGKRRVRAIDPNKGRCLIKNVENIFGINYCHLLPREVMRNVDLVSV